jgi:benzoylformate decarboxylase
MGDGSIQYAITSLWTAAQYGILKEFGAVEHTAGVPGLDLPGLDIVATARSYGVDAHEAKTTDDVAELLNAGIADRARPTLINIATTPVGA